LANAITEPWVPNWILEIRAATDDALVEAQQRALTLTARGSALDTTDAVAYLRADDRALTAP
jgi:hypothetical protein